VLGIRAHGIFRHARLLAAGSALGPVLFGPGQRFVADRFFPFGRHESGDDQVGSREIGGQRDVVHVAHPHQRLDIGIVRLRGQRVNEEKDRVDAARAHLRGDLAALGLSRDEQSLETEDHLSYLFEVMRYLIAGDDVAVCNLEQQRRFFRTHLQTWVEALCATTLAHPRADIWRAVAAFTREFMLVETQGFDLLDS